LKTKLLDWTHLTRRFVLDVVLTSRGLDRITGNLLPRPLSRLVV
jgi:hypothetical protein